MLKTNVNIYLSGEIHTNWRETLKTMSADRGLALNFFEPVTNHNNSDDCGVNILGSEDDKFWHDYKGASINAIRTKYLIEKSDIVIIRFGKEYRQWNAAFDAGLAVSLGKSLITFHENDLDHALKEIDSSANAVCRTEDQIIKTLTYVLNGKLT